MYILPSLLILTLAAGGKLASQCPEGLDEETSLLQANLRLHIRKGDSSAHQRRGVRRGADDATAAGVETSATAAAVMATAASAAAQAKDALAVNLKVAKTPSASAVADSKGVDGGSIAAGPAASQVQQSVPADTQPLIASAEDATNTDEVTAGEGVESTAGDELVAGSEAALAGTDDEQPDALSVSSDSTKAEDSSQRPMQVTVSRYTLAFLQILLALIIVPLAIAGSLAMLLRAPAAGTGQEKDRPDKLVEDLFFDHLQPQALPAAVQVT